MKAEIISIGTELLLGEITDTNASYLANELHMLGIELWWTSGVGDNQARMVEVLKRAWQRSDLILTTGGLGPTGDDLTREAIAEMMGEKLEIDPSLERELREFFGRSRMGMPLSNLKQATLIPSAKSIPNPLGTAPGWWVERDSHILVVMPGPPREMYEMWQARVKPELRRRSKSVILTKTFKTYGLGEAAVGELVSPLFSSTNPELGIYAKPDGMYLRLVAKADDQKKAEKMIAENEARIRAALNEYIWGTDNDTLGTMIGQLLMGKGLSLAFMEDYSGGSLTATIIDAPESPSFFKGGLVAHSNEAKQALGVSAKLISQYGAVSAEVAQAMAEAARKSLKADIGVSTTGVEEIKERPGTYIGIADSKGSRTIRGTRNKLWLTSAVLFELRKSLISSNET